MQRPGFWDDQETAASTSAKHARAQRRLTGFRALESDVADLDELAEMATEDEEMATELGSQLASIEKRLAELEEARLFAGDYDAGDAVVTVHAGAGGTDSQDWAEILLRMYLRWAERRGFEVEMKEASPGEEAGLKSATFIARGENAYGLFAAERGVHRLVRISPFDSSARRHTSFAQVDVAPAGRRGRRGRDRRDRPPRRHLPRLGRRRPARQQDRLRGADHPQPDRASSSSARTSAPRPRTRRSRCSCCAPKLIELEERKRAEELAKERGEVKPAEWGSQIRSYFLHPDQRVKDHRTGHESATPSACSTATSTTSSATT